MHVESREPASFQSCLEAMGQIMNYKPYYGPAAESFAKASSLTELESLYGGDNLIEIQRAVTNEKILANNKNVKKLLSSAVKPKSVFSIAVSN